MGLPCPVQWLLQLPCANLNAVTTVLHFCGKQAEGFDDVSLIYRKPSSAMRNEPDTPPQARPRVIDKIQLALSTGRRIDGIWVGSYRTPEHLTRIESALLLIKQHSPVHYSRIIGDLERVWIFLLPHGLAEYRHSLRACVLDERYVADSSTSVERIASTIIHEATHAKLERCGIRYKEELRAGIEAVCVRRELAFAARLPDSAQLREELAQHLSWYQANPEYFRDAQFLERQTNGETEVLRHIGAPDWLIRAMPTLQAMIGRVRRLFRIA